MIAFIAPVREKAKEIYENKAYLQQVMEQGAEKARKSAAKTMQEVRDAMGLSYY